MSRNNSNKSLKGRLNLKSAVVKDAMTSLPVLGGKYKEAKALLKAQRDERQKSKGKKVKTKGALLKGIEGLSQLGADVSEMIGKYGHGGDWKWSDLAADIFGKAGGYADKFNKLFMKFLPVGVGTNQASRTFSIASTKKSVQLRKLGVEQVGIASPFQINSFGAPVISSSPGGTYSIIHGDFLSPLVIPAQTKAGDQVFALDLNPYLGVWLSQMANFERYKIRKIAITYNPMCPTTTSGALAGVYEFDIDNLMTAGMGDATMKQVMSHQTASIVDVWTPHTWIFQPEDPAEWYYVVEGGHEPRLEKQGQFRLFAGADFDSELKAALLTVTYHIDFKVAEINSSAIGTYDMCYMHYTATSSTTSSSGTTSSSDKLGIPATDWTAVKMLDTDFPINGQYMSIYRNDYIHLAHSDSFIDPVTSNCSVVQSKSVPPSPGIGAYEGQPMTTLITVPSGYWQLDIQLAFADNDDTMTAVPIGDYAQAYDPDLDTNGTLFEYSEAYEAMFETHHRVRAYGVPEMSVCQYSTVIRSTGHNSVEDFPPYKSNLTSLTGKKGYVIANSTAGFIYLKIMAVPISAVRSWSTTQTLSMELARVQKYLGFKDGKAPQKKDGRNPVKEPTASAKFVPPPVQCPDHRPPDQGLKATGCPNCSR